MKATEGGRRQLLGEIETHIVGGQYHDATVRPGEHVSLEREPENEHDPNAIRVENGRCDTLGYLPRERAAWLAPLMDTDEVRVEGYVPEQAEPAADRCPLTIMVVLGSKGHRFLRPNRPRNRQDLVHQTVRRAYKDAQGYRDPGLVSELAEALKPLTAQELHPKTHLLLALIPGLAKELRDSRAFCSMVELQELLGKVTVGEPVDCRSLRVFSLIWPAASESPYMLLGPAIEQGLATVEEIDETGEVQNLSVVNKADRPILIPEGDILVGAKQNRVVNITVLVAAKSRFTLPVSCVEQGRWRYRSRQFHAGFSAPPSLRSKKMRSVHRSRRSGRRAESDQGEVWDNVEAYLCCRGVESETSSLTDGLAATDIDRESLEAGLNLPEDCAGVVVAHQDRVIGADLFDSPGTFSAMWGRLSGAYTMDALQAGNGSGEFSTDDAKQFLQRAAGTARSCASALGIGDEIEIDGKDIVGGALLYDGRLCHLYAFLQQAAT